MKVLIDTNILLDVLCKREPFWEDALKIFRLCETRQIEGCVYALSIPNLVYVMRKELSRNQIEGILCTLQALFEIVDMRADDLKKAARLPVRDFEDALQCVCAKRIKASYLVTRNLKDFGESEIMAVKPSELLDRIIS